MLGLEITGNFVSERENVDEDIVAMGKGPFKVEVDLMQPVDPDKKPAVHATPLNHVGLWIDDLPKAVEWLTANGVRFAPGGIRKGAAGFDITFLHPKASSEFPIAGEGVLIELVQAPPEVVEAFASTRLKIPAYAGAGNPRQRASLTDRPITPNLHSLDGQAGAARPPLCSGSSDGDCIGRRTPVPGQYRDATGRRLNHDPSA
jgi:lactoylglutathione lyase